MAQRRTRQTRVFENCPTFDLDIDNVVLPQCTFANVGEIYSSVTHARFSLLLFNIRSCREKNFGFDFTAYF